MQISVCKPHIRAILSFPAVEESKRNEDANLSTIVKLYVTAIKTLQTKLTPLLEKVIFELACVSVFLHFHLSTT
jgi:hypothetical protein